MSEHAKSIVAEQFVLVDSDGNEHAVLQLAATGEPQLSMSKDGVPCLSLTVCNGAPMLCLFDEMGRLRVVFTMDDGAPQLWQFDENEKPIYPGLERDAAPEESALPLFVLPPSNGVH